MSPEVYKIAEVALTILGLPESGTSVYVPAPTAPVSPVGPVSPVAPVSPVGPVSPGPEEPVLLNCDYITWVAVIITAGTAGGTPPIPAGTDKNWPLASVALATNSKVPPASKKSTKFHAGTA